MDTELFFKKLHELLDILVENGFSQEEREEYNKRLLFHVEQKGRHLFVIREFGERMTPHYDVLLKKDFSYLNKQKLDMYDKKVDGFIYNNWSTFSPKTQASLFRRLKVMYNCYVKINK